jgi:hypothetical protein
MPDQSSSGHALRRCENGLKAIRFSDGPSTDRIVVAKPFLPIQQVMQLDDIKMWPPVNCGLSQHAQGIRKVRRKASGFRSSGSSLDYSFRIQPWEPIMHLCQGVETHYVIRLHDELDGHI